MAQVVNWERREGAWELKREGFWLFYLHFSSSSPVGISVLLPSIWKYRPFCRLSAVSLIDRSLPLSAMTSLFGATVIDTPQFDKHEVAEETSPLMNARSEHLKPGKAHMAMPVVPGLPAADRSDSADTIANGQSPEPV